MSLFAEIWTRPGAAIFERVVVGDDLGPASFTRRGPSAVGEGRVILPANWDRIAEVIVREPATPANDVRRLVRAFDSAGPTYADGSPRPVYEWFLDVTSDEFSEGDVEISGPGIESIIAAALVGLSNVTTIEVDGVGTAVSPWRIQSMDPCGDYVYALSSGSLVGPWEVTVTDATGGTWTATGDGAATAAIAFDATAATVKTEIEALATVTTCTVTKSTTTNTSVWLIYFDVPDTITTFTVTH